MLKRNIITCDASFRGLTGVSENLLGREHFAGGECRGVVDPVYHQHQHFKRHVGSKVIWQQLRPFDL